MLHTATRLSFDAVDPALLGHFWAQVTGYDLVVNEPDEVRLRGAALGLDELVFREVPRWKASPNRLQVDLLSDDLDGDALHLEALGATRVAELVRRGERRVVLRDPEGNEFAIVAPPVGGGEPAPAPPDPAAAARRPRRRPSARRTQQGP
ncbi:MAG: VOC family protein [Acidimicrobiia bacterium]|nr:VOC family protein [Acidimicrobiia bacterium]